MNAALSGTDPVIFFESQKLYDTAELFHKEGVPAEYYEIPIGEPDIKRTGSDLTILSIGASLYPAISAAKEMSEKYGVEAEVIDARSLVPFNYDKLIESVKKTGRLVLISDACERGSFLNDVAANVTRLAFDYLDAPPMVVGAPNSISPCPELESFYYPQAGWILDAVLDSATSFVSAPTGMIILLTVGYDLVLRDIPWKKTAGLIAMRLLVMAVCLGVLLALNQFCFGNTVFVGAAVLMCLLPPPYVIPVFADEPSERVQISSALSALTLVTMVLFALYSVILGMQS